MQEELRREVELISGFVHRNIVAFYNAFRHPAKPEAWLVMELCELGALRCA